MNKLQYETSPYLLQHAHNPVDWYAWKPEAYEKAKKQLLEVRGTRIRPGLDDDAFFIEAILDVYEINFDTALNWESLRLYPPGYGKIF